MWGPESTKQWPKKSKHSCALLSLLCYTLEGAVFSPRGLCSAEVQWNKAQAVEGWDRHFDILGRFGRETVNCITNKAVGGICGHFRHFNTGDTSLWLFVERLSVAVSTSPCFCSVVFFLVFYTSAGFAWALVRDLCMAARQKDVALGLPKNPWQHQSFSPNNQGTGEAQKRYFGYKTKF